MIKRIKFFMQHPNHKCSDFLRTHLFPRATLLSIFFHNRAMAEPEKEEKRAAFAEELEEDVDCRNMSRNANMLHRLHSSAWEFALHEGVGKVLWLFTPPIFQILGIWLQEEETEERVEPEDVPYGKCRWDFFLSVMSAISTLHK